jgi:hypothetical protein
MTSFEVGWLLPKLARPSVVDLLFHSGPSAVAGLIVAIVINAID